MSKHPRTLFSFLLLLTLAWLDHPVAYAQDPPPVEGETLPEIIVTPPVIIESNRVDPFASLTTEVTSRQVDDLNAIDLSSALRRTPGVKVSRFNPVGAFGGAEGGAVFIRGTGASRPGSEIKTYVDGVPFYMGVWNHSLLDLIPIHAMDRLIVHKGPHPHSFGNNFSAINLVPLRRAYDGREVEFQLSGGSFATVVEHATVQGKSGRLDYLLSQGFARSDGHRDNADGRLLNGMARIGYRMAPGWSTDLLLLHADNSVSDPGRIDLIDSSTGTFETRGTMATLSVRHRTDRANGRLQLYVNGGVGNWTDHPVDPNTRSEFLLSGVRLREALTLFAQSTLIAGVDLDRIDGKVMFDGSTGFEGDALTLVSPYVSLSSALDVTPNLKVTPSAGVRLHAHNVLSTRAAAQAGLLLDFGTRFQLRGAITQGYNYPGLDVAILNTIVPPLAMNNPASWENLNPERVDHFEVGLAYTFLERVQLDLALFADRYKDRYIFAFPPVVSSPSFTNLGDYDVRGAEASLQYQQSVWGLFTGITLFEPSRSNHPYVPDASIVLGGSVQAGSWRFSADAQIQSDMHVLNTARTFGELQTSKVDEFALFNLRVSRSAPWIGSGSEVFIAVENVLDATYAYRTDYPMPGRWAQLGFRLGL